MSEEYTCEECGKTFDSKRGLHIHIGEVHPDKKEELFSKEVRKESKKKQSKKKASKTSKESSSFFGSQKSLIASIGVAVVLIVAAMLLFNVSGIMPGDQSSGVINDNETAAQPGKVVATVNGEPITANQVASVEQRVSLSGQNVSQRAIIEELVKQEILDQQAKKEGYTVSKQEVEQMLMAQMAGQNMSLSELKQMVAQQGGSWEQQIENYRRQLATQNYIEETIAGQVAPVTEQEIQQYYQAYKQQSQQEVPTLEQVKQQINLTLQQQKRQQAINALVEQLKPNYDIEYK